MSQSKHTPEPLDCPCGSAWLPDVMKSITNQYRVRCICGRAGPFSLSRLEAIAGWNRQAAAPDLLEAARLGLRFANAYESLDMDQEEGYYDTDDDANRDKIKAAIAKAEVKP